MRKLHGCLFTEVKDKGVLNIHGKLFQKKLSKKIDKISKQLILAVNILFIEGNKR